MVHSHATKDTINACPINPFNDGKIYSYIARLSAQHHH